MGFVVYIDESGDEGFSLKSSKWFSMSCIIVRKENDLSLVKHRNNICNQISVNKNKPLQTIHFADLRNHEQRKYVCKYLSEEKVPIRAINVIINKSSIPEKTLNNYKQDRNRFYWYTARLLFERISWFLKDKDVKYPQIVFSNRKQSKVQDFLIYLNKLKQEADNNIDWKVFSIDEKHIKSISHEKMAGLQIADVFATAFRKYMFECNSFGDVESSYAEILKPFVYNVNKNYRSYGLKILGEYNQCNIETVECLRKHFNFD